MSEGYFFADQASQDALKQRQAYAQALLAAGQQDPGSSKYGGLANAGKEILGALLQNWSNKDAAKLSAEDKTKYADAITKMLGPGETKPGAFPTEAGDLNAMGTTNKGSLVDSLGADRSKAYADMLSGLQPGQGMQMLPQIMQQGFQRQDQLSDEARQHAQMAQDKQMTPLTPEETQKLGLRGTFERDAFGNIKAVQESDTLSPEALAQKMQMEKMQQAPQWAQVDLSRQKFAWDQQHPPGQNAPMGYQWTPDGKQKFIPGGPADPATKPMTDDQTKAAGFSVRAQQAAKIIDRVGSDQGTSMFNRTIGSIPLMGNQVVSKDFQLEDQAERNFINAMLRRESGAAISDSEFDNARKQYFPQPGDAKPVLEQKAANRKTAIDSLTLSAGPRFKPPAAQKDDPLGLR